MSKKKPASNHPWRSPLYGKKSKPLPTGNKIPKAKLSLVAPPETSFQSDQLDTFLYWIRERHSIHLLKESGAPAPWTRDSILQSTFFCNPFRENDKTTVWFRENLRGSVYDFPSGKVAESGDTDQKLACSPLVILATVAFRWFNFIPTGETLISWGSSEEVSELENCFLSWPSETVRSILHYLSEDRGEKVFTGAYIIKSPNGQNKIDGICDCIDIVARCLNWLKGSATLPKEIRVGLNEYSPQEVLWADEEQDEARCDFLHDLLLGRLSLEQAHQGLMLFPFLGDFMAYEVVTDLRHTKYLCNAPDIMSWANLGPGAIRGLLRLTGQFTPGPANGSYRAPKDSQDLMDELLAICQAYFNPPPQRGCKTITGPVFPTFEMRDIEHSLCEFDKYSRVLNGEGSVKRLYDGT